MNGSNIISLFNTSAISATTLENLDNYRTYIMEKFPYIRKIEVIEDITMFRVRFKIVVLSHLYLADYILGNRLEDYINSEVRVSPGIHIDVRVLWE